jgi:mannose-6-phosphate isomerase-like protein (cupin superfamily)
MSDAAKQTDPGLPTIVADYGASLLDAAVWVRVTDGCRYRDLCLSHASESKMAARHYRAGAAQAMLQIPGEANAKFSFLFVLSGRITITPAKGESIRLNSFDAAARYGGNEPARIMLSHGAEFICVVSIDNDAGLLGNPGEGRWRVSREEETAYHLGQGPRRYFSYRNLGIDELTERRIHIHLVRAQQSVAGGTGFHTHTMGQMFYVLRGSADLDVADRPSLYMKSGDAMCIAPHMKHDVARFSDDYLVLEMCVPADYDTSDVAAPSPIV